MSLASSSIAVLVAAWTPSWQSNVLISLSAHRGHRARTDCHIVISHHPRLENGQPPNVYSAPNRMYNKTKIQSTPHNNSQSIDTFCIPGYLVRVCVCVTNTTPWGPDTSQIFQQWILFRASWTWCIARPWSSLYAEGPHEPIDPHDHMRTNERISNKQIVFNSSCVNIFQNTRTCLGCEESSGVVTDAW